MSTETVEPIELKPVIAPEQPTSTDLAKIDLQAVALSRFGNWRAEAARLVAKYTGVVFDVATTKGMAEAAAARAEVRAPRYAAQAVSKASKSELAKVSKAIGAEEQAVIDALAATEDHIHKQIEAELTRKAEEKAERDRVEAARKERHELNIAKIRAYLASANGLPSDRLARGVAFVEAMTFGAEWEEYADLAAAARDETLLGLRAMLAAAQAAEAAAAAAEAQRVEQARIAAEQAAEAERLRQAAEALAAQQRAAAAELAAQQAELARQKAEFEAAQAKAAADKLADEQAAQADQAAQEAQAMQVAQAKEAADKAFYVAIADENVTADADEAFYLAAVDAEAADQADAMQAAHTPQRVMYSPSSPADKPTDDRPPITTGEICERLGAGFSVSVPFITGLGFTPAETPAGAKAGTFWHADDFVPICRAIITHVESVMWGAA